MKLNHSLTRSVSRLSAVSSLFIVSITNLAAMSSVSNALSSSPVLRVHKSGVESVNQNYVWQEPSFIPPGFEKVCNQNRWNPQSMWNNLNSGNRWLRATSNEAYIYYNNADGHWWIDEPNGKGVFIAPSSDKNQPPKDGWKALDANYVPMPEIEELS